ncbi:hypothetical protein O3M35_000848 [Rhynocoris fuscipes]|uniref:Uncharacterized protein n=1 Tax=Rhynocoris fuscipes TaxID=488301 RepID=A0AAW1DP40_9HEMI
MIPQRIIDYIQEFDKENNEDIERLIKQEYGIYVKLFAVYPSLKPNNLLFTFIQVFIFLSIDLIFLSLQIYSVILVSSDISLFSVCIHYFLLISLNFSFSVLALVNRKYLTRMYRILHEGFYDYKDGSNNDPYVQRVKDNAQKAKYLFSFLPLYILFTGITLVTIGPIIDDAQTTKLNITMEGFNIRLPVAKWYPYSTEDDIPFYLTLLGQAILAALVAGVIGTFDLLYITITQELIAQLHILNYSLLNLKKRAINKCKEIYGNINIKDYNNDDRYHRCYYYCIRQNIIHHQTIIE